MYKRIYRHQKAYEYALKHTRCALQRYAPTVRGCGVVSILLMKRQALSTLNYRVNYRRSALSRFNRRQCNCHFRQRGRAATVYTNRVLALYFDTPLAFNAPGGRVPVG